MGDKIYYTRSGLSRCGGCGQHFFLKLDSWREAECPFCGASINSQLLASPEESVARHRLGKSRIATGLLALGLGAGVGCSDEELIEREDAMSSPVDQRVDLAPNPVPDLDVSEYGGPLLEDLEPPAPLYGGAPIPDQGVPPEDLAVPEIDMAPDFGDVAEYGAPPLPEPDLGMPTLDMTPDDSAQPEYGAPPLPDEED